MDRPEGEGTSPEDRWGRSVDRSTEYIDKTGRALRIAPYRAGDDDLLIEMYDGFSPKGIYQGMPPVGKEACRRWIRGLIEAGESFMA